MLLEDEKGNGKVAISAALQARVMTTTANGWSGKGYGWINKKHFISGDTLENINVYRYILSGKPIKIYNFLMIFLYFEKEALK